MNIQINTPLDKKMVSSLSAGDTVLINGVLYTARDAAHARLIKLIESGRSLPFDIRGAVIYYVGPSPAKPGKIIGSAGPTTSYRMDAYTPQLIEAGMGGMIGKGYRSEAVISSMKEHGAVYFGAIGGAAALIAKCIESSEIVCYEDLGAEAIRRLTVRGFPATVVIDSNGDNLYEIGVANYLRGCNEAAKKCHKS